jgi:hypothetical protein
MQHTAELYTDPTLLYSGLLVCWAVGLLVCWLQGRGVLYDHYPDRIERHNRNAFPHRIA